jgi:hypothetical protein
MVMDDLQELIEQMEAIAAEHQAYLERSEPSEADMQWTRVQP